MRRGRRWSTSVIYEIHWHLVSAFSRSGLVPHQNNMNWVLIQETFATVTQLPCNHKGKGLIVGRQQCLLRFFLFNNITTTLPQVRFKTGWSVDDFTITRFCLITCCHFRSSTPVQASREQRMMGVQGLMVTSSPVPLNCLMLLK